MDTKGALKCFVVGMNHAGIDPALESQGVANGIMMFSIPEFGIIFRCRAAGQPVDLEFGALFALSKFIQSKLADQKIKKLHIFSSNPEFVFSFAGNSRHLKADTERMRLLTKFNHEFQMAVSFIDAIKNQALVSPADYPSMPAGRTVDLKKDDGDRSKPRFRPVQKGIKL